MSARQRLEQKRQAFGENHPEYATGLNQLALLLIMHGNPDHAEPLLRQALEIRRETLGEKHPDFATNLSSLAGLLWARGDLDGAEPLMRQALEIRWDVFGNGHPKTTASLNSLEQLLRAKQDWQGVERLAAGPSTVAPAPAPDPVPVEEAVTPPPPPPPSPPLDPAPVSPPPQPDEPVQPVEAPQEAPPVIESLAPVTPVETHEPEVSDRSSSGTQEPAAGGQGREALIARHEALAAQFSRVGEQLAREAEEWKSGGAPPSPALIEDLNACGRDFEQLRDDLVRLAGALRANVAPDELANLEDVSNVLHVLGEAEGRQAQLEAVRGQAMAALDRILSLVQADRKEFAPLVDCQAKARALRASIADAPVLDLPEETAPLAEGDHPFHALLTLVEGDGLSDDVWAESLERVESEFGKALSVAVARSKIIQP